MGGMVPEPSAGKAVSSAKTNPLFNLLRGAGVCLRMPHSRERIALTLRWHFPQSLHGLVLASGCLIHGNVFPQGFPLRERVLATGQQRERIPAGFPSSPAGACISIIKDSKSKASVTQTNKRKQMRARQNLPAPYVPFEKGKHKKCTLRGPSLLHTFPRCRI